HFHEADTRPDRFFFTKKIRSIRHVTDKKGATRPAPDRPQVVKHFIHRDRERRIVSQHHLGERVPDQNHVDPGLVHQPRRGVVVRGQTGDLLGVQFSIEDVRNSDLAHGLKLRVHGDTSGEKVKATDRVRRAWHADSRLWFPSTYFQTFNVRLPTLSMTCLKTKDPLYHRSVGRSSRCAGLEARGGLHSSG